ncbi:anti-CBASS protein Acb1 family protein [Novosphingobium sp.]|uniref:phage portal protein n=1 Tax=Novosphingobium sp. TaxID=1874826 RepID=UPI00286E3288|nr:anti-CBASS Acb1 family protein [Novosphingobium sp.]
MGKVLQLFDGLINAMSGTGTAKDARSYNQHQAVALTQYQIDAAYRGSGLMRKIIQIPAMDAVREWRDWKLEADQITLIEAEEKRLAIRQKVRQAEVLRGLGGGALILGLPGNPDQPAPAAAKGSLAYVHVVSRWHLTFDALQDDARLPGYGEPAMWAMQAGTGPVKIHPSRVIPFRADTSASLAMPATSPADAFWGESTVAQVLDAVQDSDMARSAFAAMLHKARLTRIGIPDLMGIAATPGGEASLQKRMQAVAIAESIHNATIYNAGDPETGKGGETITDATYSFAGAKDMINAYAEFVSAISDIPATRLLGRAPEGMNSSGDSQQKDWKKLVRARQELDIGPCIQRLDEYLVPSALGMTPDGQWFDWAPLDTPDQKETAERFKLHAEALNVIANMGIMPERALAKGAQSLLIDEGYMPELEAALAEIPDDERFGIEPANDPQLEEGGDPASTGMGGDPEPPPIRAKVAANDAAPRSLYVRRDLINGQEFIAWAKSQGFETTLDAGDLHVTIAYSRQAIDWMKVESGWDSEDGTLTVPPGGARIVEPLGDKGAVVLLFTSSTLSWRHENIIRAGASHDFDQYQPHVTISYKTPEGLDLSKVEPFRGKLIFGPEVFEELDADWTGKIEES